MMSYINETDFVIENKKLVYPEIVTDGLQLYYDAKGKRDTDYHRDTMLDMSGNKNHGKLHNFAYEKHSGYKDGLVFDYIDDKLVRPTLDLKHDDFTFMLNGNIISFSPDGTVKRVQDGEVIESKGFNLIENGNVKSTYTYETVSYINFLKTGEIVGPINYTNTQSIIPAVTGHEYYVRAIFSQGTVRQRLYFIYEDNSANFNDGALAETDIVSGIITAVKTANANLRMYGSAGEKTKESIMVIDLTETFGAGNEPTKEQMDEIINRFGFIPNAQDLIDRIEYKGNDLGDMENIIDGLYKTEILSGNPVFTDKADDAVVHVEVDGLSVGGGSGKNLLNGVNSLMRFSGSGLINTGSRTSLKAGTYTFSVQEIKGMTKWRMYWAVFKNGILVEETSNVATHFSTGGIYYSFNGNKMYLSSSDTSQKSYTIILDDDYEIAWGFSGGDSTETSEMLYPQIELGSTATAYEPPEPTPDYPVEIHSLNDFDVVSSGVGRNYVLSSDFSDGWNNWRNSSGSRGTFVEYDTYPGKKFLRIDNSDGSLSNPFVQSYTSVGEAGKYTLSWLQKGTGNVIIQNASEENGNLTPRVQGIFTGDFSRHSLTLDIEEGNPKARIVFQSFDGNDISVTNVQLEKGNKATDWAPAPEDITESDNHPLIDKINLLLDEPLRSLGDVNDRLFRDSDGLWKIERKVGEYSFTGNEAFTLFENTRTNTQSYTIYPATNPFFNNLASFTSNTATKNLVSNRFVVRDSTAGDFDFATGYSVEGNKWIWFQVSRSHLTQQNVIGFKEWLTQNPTIITYSINPFIEILSQPLQDKLNNLSSFEDSNYVYTVLPNEDNYLTDNLKPTLHAKFLYNNWYKEDRVINNLMIYNRALTNEEMLQNYKTIKRRWGM